MLATWEAPCHDAGGSGDGAAIEEVKAIGYIGGDEDAAGGSGGHGGIKAIARFSGNLGAAIEDDRVALQLHRSTRAGAGGSCGYHCAVVECEGGGVESDPTAVAGAGGIGIDLCLIVEIEAVGIHVDGAALAGTRGFGGGFDALIQEDGGAPEIE